MSNPLVSLIEAEGVAGELFRALRQGIYFGIETRIPYGITTIMRPYLFNKPARPLLGSLKFIAAQTEQHGWIIARISFIFKLIEMLLARVAGGGKVQGWHTFIAGAVAGHLIMYKEKANATLKKQINMAIGIRTIYALGAYMVRNSYFKAAKIDHSAEGYDTATNLWYTLMWGVVMWHWRHYAVSSPGEMNPAQVTSMNFIYNDGDKPGIAKWTGNNYLIWAIVLIAARYIPDAKK